MRPLWLLLAGLVVSCGPDRMLILGFDSANWDSLHELMAKGSLPQFHALVEGGTSGPLETFVPTASPAIWTSMATGRSPHVHGISLRVLAVDGGGEHEMVAALSSHGRRVPALWNLFTQAGVPSAFVRWWATCPAESVLGCMVSDRVQEPADAVTYPSALREELAKAGVFDGALPPAQERVVRQVEARFRAWRRGVEEGAIPWRGDPGHAKAYLADLEERLRAYRRIMASDYATERITTYLLERFPEVRVVAPYFWYLDVCQHLFWKYWRPQGFSVDPGELEVFAPLVPEYYRFLDQVAARLRRASKASRIVVVSDHGMEASTADRCINDLFDVQRLLEDAGWAHRTAQGGVDTLSSRAWVFAESRQVRLLRVRDRTRDAPALVEFLASLRATPSAEPLFSVVRPVEGESSFVAKDFVVWLFENGDVAALLNLGVPVSDSLDLGGRRLPLTRWNRWQPQASGQHTEGPPGIIILWGKGFARGRTLAGAKVADVAPTVMASLGLPVAQDLEGRPLVEAFTPSFLRRHPLVWVPTYGVRSPGTGDAPAGQDAGLVEQLRALGYIR